jgi:hypothetical protein
MSKKTQRDHVTAATRVAPAPDLATLPGVIVVKASEPPIGHFVRHAYAANGELINDAG